MTNLTDGSSSLRPLPAAVENECKTEITMDTVGISSLTTYRDGVDEIRWSPVFLLHDSGRPRNLDVLTYNGSCLKRGMRTLLPLLLTRHCLGCQHATKQQ